MQVVIIGSGNVATVVGRLIKQKGHSILQIIRHQSNSADDLAAELGADVAELSSITNDADLYILAIKDYAISVVTETLQLKNKLIVHTSGAFGKDILCKVSDKVGVLWPIQTIRKETEYIPEIPFVVEGNLPEVTNELVQFVQSLDQKVVIADEEERKKLHIAAVFSNNFVNHFYALAEDFCRKEQLDFSLLNPLIRETAHRLAHHSPAMIQTGPAVRGDIVTIEKHLRTLERYPYLRKFYLRLSNSIMQSPYK